MPKGNWKSLAFLGAVALLAGVIFLNALASLVGLPLNGWTGLLPLTALLVLTVAASRFTVSVMNADGVRQSTKSVADTFIFLAAMMYATGSTGKAAPAVLLAAVVGFITSLREADRRLTIFNISASVVSTFVAASLYGLLINLIAVRGSAQSLTLNELLLPVCVMALAQYFLCTIGVAAFVAFDSGKPLTLSKESLVWTSITQIAAAASAGLFYAALETRSFIHLFVGALITGLVYLLYRFNDQRLEEVRRAEADKVLHVQEMADLHMNTIESLAIAIDAKDQTTHGHVRRTQIYAKEMGRLLKVTEAESQALLAGALLHDVGKLAVPEYILNKPGKLTESEFAKMKIHPIVGAEILKRVNFPYPVEDIVRYHHEKWDGTGYPKGLKGENIPLVARIIAVVDFYDATRCDRPYRKGMKREDSISLLKKMSGTSFDPRIVEMFTENIEEFDRLIASQDIEEQVQPEREAYHNNAKPDTGLVPETLGEPDNRSGFRSITQAQREVFALHEIAQTIGSSLNLHDTVTLVTSKLRAIVPFDTCTIYIVDDKSGKAVAIHVAGEHADTLLRRRINVGDGITGWVIANARTMCNTSPELDLVGVPEEIAKSVLGVLVAPLINESGAFGAITLYSKSIAAYSTEHVRLLESVSLHASSALNNAITFEKTRESALTDPLTDLPNARAFYMSLQQRVAECQRLNREPVTILSMDLDDFKKVNDTHGHAVGDRMLASVAEVIRKQLRQMDLLARYAGDEFVAIMPMASEDTAAIVAERIRAAVEKHEFTVRTGRTARVGLSIGIASFPRDGETAEELLTSADRNMQRDKHSRKLGPAMTPNSNIASIDMLT
ncbi:MAG TPA: diguanylate cyclase [Pyrinomonadaceae bacterium]|jgi:diguanylate cyclase (GGDEF)-like protein/putative nucleotidyltransferase with HDIG domain